MGERLALIGYTAGWRLVRLLPESVAYALFTLIADVIWWRGGPSVARLESNLRRVVPERTGVQLRELSREGMRSYLRYWCDAFRLASWSQERTVDAVRLVDGDLLWNAQAQGRGLVVALSHQGNWDHAGAWSTYRLAKVVTVAERLRPAGLFDRFVAYRESLGMEILPLTGDGSVLPTLIRRVKAGGFVPLLMDRDLTGSGVPVTFFGETARMAAGPAALALATKAPLLPVNLHYERLPRGSMSRWGLVITIHPAVEVPQAPRAEQILRMTQSCADALATGIRAHPQDWHMLQRVFDTDLN
jgi:phosphatidylinositol dimannoside acyltransferase